LVWQNSKDTKTKKSYLTGGIDKATFEQATLTELSDAAAESLSKHNGEYLSLDGLTELSDAAAESFSKHEGDLNLGGLTTLSDAAAASLSKRKGDGDLMLDNLPDSAARILRDAGDGDE